MKHIYSILLFSLLGGCSTPQERAIAAYCGAEAQKMVPQQLASQQVVRSVYVGEKIVGNKNICKTEIKESNDKKGGAIKTRETVCRDEPILEPVYQEVLSNEFVDLNANQRQAQIQICTSEALAKGMYLNAR